MLDVRLFEILVIILHLNCLRSSTVLLRFSAADTLLLTPSFHHGTHLLCAARVRRVRAATARSLTARAAASSVPRQQLQDSATGRTVSTSATGGSQPNQADHNHVITPLIY